MEYTAEDLIAHKLQRAGILVAKPKFDHNGADLLVLLDVQDNAKFCRVQCKGRSLSRSKGAHVRIPKEYATDGFTLFLFVETGESEKTYLYCLLGKDIRADWHPTDNNYVLNITQKTFEAKLAKYTFDARRTIAIQKAIINVNVTGEFNIMNHGGAELELPYMTMRGGNQKP